MKRSLVFTAAIVAAALSGGVTAWGVAQLTEQRGASPASADRSEFAAERLPARFTASQEGSRPDLTDAAEHAVQAVVNIEKTEEVEAAQSAQLDPFFEFFGIPRGSYGPGNGGPQERRSGGSGVIISEDGYVVTNNHVVENASKLRVKLNDGRTFDGRVVGTDPTTDVALIKIDGEKLPTLSFGSSQQLRLGEWVLAIGSPFDLQSTITAGIVSAKARKLDVIPSDRSIESFIQTDAAVNPGNSGGALVNTRGELVGINTVIKSPTGSYIGYSFAIPETIVRKVVVDLKEYGVVQRAMLGIVFRPVDQEFIEQMGEESGIRELGGVFVVSIDPEGAASAAGLRKGDVILEVDGVKVNDKAPLQEEIAKHRPNDKVQITAKRGDAVKHFEVTLRNKAGKTELLTREDVDVASVLGGKFADVGEKLARRLDIKGGIEVVRVNPGGILGRARVREGFVITHINDRAVRSVADMNRLTEPVRSIDGLYPDGRAASYIIVQ